MVKGLGASQGGRFYAGTEETAMTGERKVVLIGRSEACLGNPTLVHAPTWANDGGEGLA